MRALVLPPWPSATKMSPFGAVTTADGALNSSGPLPGVSGLAERHQHLAVGAELEHLVAFAVAAEAVGHPHVAVAVDVQAVREQQQAGAEALQQLAGRIEFEDRVEVRTRRKRTAGRDRCATAGGIRRSARRPRRWCRRDRWRPRWSSPMSGLRASVPQFSIERYGIGQGIGRRAGLRETEAPDRQYREEAHSKRVAQVR